MIDVNSILNYYQEGYSVGCDNKQNWKNAQQTIIGKALYGQRTATWNLGHKKNEIISSSWQPLQGRIRGTERVK